MSAAAEADLLLADRHDAAGAAGGEHGADRGARRCAGRHRQRPADRDGFDRRRRDPRADRRRAGGDLRRRRRRSGLEPVEAHPGVGLGRAGLLDVEAVAAVGRLHGVVRHSDGRSRNCWRKSSVAQIWPGSTSGSTRAAQRIASPPTMTVRWLAPRRSSAPARSAARCAGADGRAPGRPHPSGGARSAPARPDRRRRSGRRRRRGSR